MQNKNTRGEHMKRNCLLVVVELIVILNITGCIGRTDENNNSSDYVSQVLENLHSATIEEIVAECHNLQGTKYDNFVLPETIIVSADAKPCSFDASLKNNKLIEKKELFKLIFNEPYSPERFEILNAEKFDAAYDFIDTKNGDQLYIQCDGSITYLKTMEPYQWQLVLQGNSLDGEYYDADVSEIQSSRYSELLNKISNAIKTKNYSYNLGRGWSVNYDNHTIDYYYLDTYFNDIKFNSYKIFNGDGYTDSKHGVYRLGLGNMNHISFVDKECVGNFEMFPYDEPQNIVRHDKILSLENALEILEKQLSDKVNIKFRSIELVYVGETEDYKLDSDTFGYPTFVLKDIHQTLHYHPFWMFTTVQENAWGHAHDVGNGYESAFYVDALTGECSTYTEPRGN